MRGPQRLGFLSDARYHLLEERGETPQTTGPAPLRTWPTRAMSQSGPSVRLASFGLTICWPEDTGVPAPHNCPGDPEASYVGRWALIGIVCRASLGSVPLWFGDDRLAELPGDRCLGNGVPVMNCQDVRELFSARSSAGIGLTERALAEAHVTACSDCARAEWPPKLESDSRAVERVIRWWVKAGAAITRSTQMITPLRLCLASSLKLRTDHVVQIIPVRTKQVTELLVRLDLPFRSFWKRATAEGAKTIRLARTSSERLLARLRVPLTRWFKGAATDGIGATRVGITARRASSGPVVGGIVGLRGIADRYARLGTMRPRPSQWYARAASTTIKARRGVTRVVRQIVPTTSGWARRRESLAQRVRASVSMIRTSIGSMRTSLPGPAGMTPGTIGVLRISSGILAAALIAIVVAMMPELSGERRAPSSEDDRPSSRGQDPAALTQRESTATAERAEIPAPIPRRVQAEPGVGSPPETRLATRPLAPVGAEIPAPVRTPARVLGEESPAPTPARSDDATSAREPLPAMNSRPSQTADAADDPSAVIDWLLSREHK
jgi:hypothetical protein